MVDQETGFFMRPVYLKTNQSFVDWPFVPLAGGRAVRVSYGRLEARAEVPPLRGGGGGGGAKYGSAPLELNAPSHEVEGRWTVTVHSISDVIRSERPTLQVGCHHSLPAHRVLIPSVVKSCTSISSFFSSMLCSVVDRV